MALSKKQASHVALAPNVVIGPGRRISHASSEYHASPADMYTIETKLLNSYDLFRIEARDIPRLSGEEQLRLFQRYWSEQDPAGKARIKALLMEHTVPFIRATVYKIWIEHQDHIEYVDLLQDAMVLVGEGIESMDPQRNARNNKPFVYLLWRVKMLVKQNIVRNYHAIRLPFHVAASAYEVLSLDAPLGTHSQTWNWCETLVAPDSPDEKEEERLDRRREAVFQALGGCPLPVQQYAVKSFELAAYEPVGDEPAQPMAKSAKRYWLHKMLKNDSHLAAVLEVGA